MAKLRFWALVPLVCLCAAGCLWTGTEHDAATVPTRFRPELAAGAVIMDIAVLERPFGDPYLNKELWTHTDEMIVELDKKAALEANGLRVGQVVGMSPAELQKLLNSKRWNNRPFRRICSSGQGYTYDDLAPIRPHCDYDIVDDEGKHEMSADQVRFCFDVLPTHTDDGKTKLRFTPKVETGEQMLPFQPAPDQARWQFQIQRPSKTYRQLSWEVTLAPNEYFIIGGRLDQPGTLGYCAFTQDDGPEQVQRVLVIRTNRSLQTAGSAPTFEELARASASPPLAAQATMGAVRASRP